MFTPEHEIDELHRELGRTRRLLFYKERAGFDHRVCDYIQWSDSLAATRARVRVLEHDLAVAQAAVLAE
jgi:hypothetical protein